MLYYSWDFLNKFNNFSQKLEDKLWYKINNSEIPVSNQKIKVLCDYTTIDDKLSNVWYKKINQGYKKISFSSEIKTFYKEYESRGFTAYEGVSKLAKILSGDFVEEGKRLHTWKKRFKKFCEFYDCFDKKYDVDKEIIKLQEILELNSYLKMNHFQIYKKLKQKMDEVKFSKVKRAVKKIIKKIKNASKNKKNNCKKSQK